MLNLIHILNPPSLQNLTDPQQGNKKSQICPPPLSKSIHFFSLLASPWQSHGPWTKRGGKKLNQRALCECQRKLEFKTVLQLQGKKISLFSTTNFSLCFFSLQNRAGGRSWVFDMEEIKEYLQKRSYLVIAMFNFPPYNFGIQQLVNMNDIIFDQIRQNKNSRNSLSHSSGLKEN